MAVLGSWPLMSETLLGFKLANNHSDNRVNAFLSHYRNQCNSIPILYSNITQTYSGVKGNDNVDVNLF